MKLHSAVLRALWRRGLMAAVVAALAVVVAAVPRPGAAR
jgi:hypothetical protein